MVGTLPRLWFWLDPSPSYTSHWYSSGENRDRVSDPMLVYGHSSLSLYGLCTLFDLPLQYAYFSSRFNPPLFPSFWKFSPLSYSEMRFRGFCSTNTFENRGSSPHCGSEPTDPNLQWELLALRLVGRLSRESLENLSSDFRSAHSSSSIFSQAVWLGEQWVLFNPPYHGRVISNVWL